MAYSRLKSRDANRYCKKYSYVRVPKVPILLGDRPVYMETKEIVFEDVESVTHTFDQDFPETPIVTVTHVESSGTDNIASVNLFLEQLNKHTVTVSASENFSGTVMMHAIYIQG